MSVPLIETINLKKYFKTKNGNLHAVDDVNLTIAKGETLGVVGESGCGKSTLGRVMLRLLPHTGGDVLFEGESLFSKDKQQMKLMHQKMQFIFQDPYSSLNPRMTASESIEEPLISSSNMSRPERAARVRQLMDTVGLATRFINSYPHELDGGRRQRIGVARALALKPMFIVCDEPVSALDVSIQAQILNLLMDLQDEMGFSYLFITHDLSVVKHISNHIAVMYLGKCIERAPTDELFSNPLHPYTKALLNAIPVPDPLMRNKNRELIRGEVSSPIEPPPGCRFVARCPHASPICAGCDIPLIEISPGHFVSCVLHQNSMG